MGITKPLPRLNEAEMEQSMTAALAASPLYTAHDPQHFDPITLLAADLLWDFIEAIQPKELIKLRKQFPDTPTAPAFLSPAAHPSRLGGERLPMIYAIPPPPGSSSK